MNKAALLIGVSEYNSESGLKPLPSAAEDVQAMQRILLQSSEFTAENITVLINPQKHDVEESIYQLFADRQKEDLLLFYFSGHGIKDETGKLYFSLPTTRKNQNGSLMKYTAIPATVLHESMNDSRSTCQVLVLDCCFSGAFAKGLAIKGDGNIDIRAQLGGKGRAIFTSSTATEYSFHHNDSKLSVYTHFFVQGLETEEADLDSDGLISADEMHTYVSEKVRQAVPKMTPQFFPVEQGHKIYLARSVKVTPANILVLVNQAKESELEEDYESAKKLWCQVIETAQSKTQITEARGAIARLDRKRTRFEGDRSVPSNPSVDRKNEDHSTVNPPAHSPPQFPSKPSEPAKAPVNPTSKSKNTSGKSNPPISSSSIPPSSTPVSESQRLLFNSQIHVDRRPFASARSKTPRNPKPLPLANQTSVLRQLIRRHWQRIIQVLFRYFGRNRFSQVQLAWRNAITAKYVLFSFTGISFLVLCWIAVEWQRFSVRPLPVSTQGPVIVYARDEETLLRRDGTSLHSESKNLSDFSSYLPKAVIASEDSRYYWHLGVDPIKILHSLLTNIRGSEIRESSSTVTQQLARSIFRDYVGTEDSVGRKLREAVVALKLETFYSKDFLMLTYLNRVYLGSGGYGFEDATRFYFGKSAKDLSLSEAATLVGILSAPNNFNPIKNYDTAVKLRDRVISHMVAQGVVSEEEAQRARQSQITFNSKAAEEPASTIAPYFNGQVFWELETLLGSQLAQEGNFIVESSLNPQMQSKAESSLRNAVTTTGASAGFSQGALVTLDTRTGEVLAMVGGIDFQQSQFNQATEALRQPGSTFKVFAYTAAIEQGISPSTAFSCKPLNWQGQFFDGCQSGGEALDMYAGLARSENVVALRVGQEVGLDNVVRTARRMGITSKLNPVPGLVLGQNEVTLLELTTAYSVLANQGVRNPPHTINRIFDGSECTNANDPKTCRIFFDYQKDAKTNQRAIDPQVANTMTNLLQGVIQEGEGKDAYLGLGEAGKTGITRDGTDLWFVGYVPDQALVTGIWLGNGDHSPTNGDSNQAATLWKNYMSEIVR